MSNRMLVASALADRYVIEGRESWHLYTADGPNRVASIATIPRPVTSLTSSLNLKRIVANVRDYRADAWMSKVIP